MMVLILCAATLLAQAPSDSVTEQISRRDSPFALFPDWDETDLLRQVRAVLDAHDLAAAISSAAELNVAGFRLYERGEYADAQVLFRASIFRDPGYVYPYSNLASCIGLRISGGERPNLASGGEIADREAGPSVKEAVFALHGFMELLPDRRAKIDEDNDFDALRQEPAFIAMRSAYWEPSDYQMQKGELLLVIGNQEYSLGSPSTDGVTPYVLMTSDGVVFGAPTLEGDDLFYATDKGLVRRITADGRLFWDLGPQTVDVALSPDGTSLVFAKERRLWVYRIPDRTLRLLSEPPEPYFWDMYPQFVNNETVRFGRGTMFEYSFAGTEWEVHLPTGAERELADGRVWHGEDLRGGP